MRAVVQRCRGARVETAGRTVGGFAGPGLAVLVGVARDDTADRAARLAGKIWNLRLFEAERYLPAGGGEDSARRELSAADLGLPVLVVSQFTLYGRTDKGRRPTWEDAAPGPQAQPLVDEVVRQLESMGADVSVGPFGADMQVHLVNDGPMTLILES